MRTALTPVLLLAAGCSDYKLFSKDDVNGTDDTGVFDDTGVTDLPGECGEVDLSPTEVGFTDLCSDGEGSFTPIIEWNAPDGGCLAGPAVGDLDADGIPNIVYVHMDNFFSSAGKLVALNGDGSGTLWEAAPGQIAYGTPPAMGDLDGDGSPEVVAVRIYEDNLFGPGEFSLIAFDSAGQQIWESVHFIEGEFDRATAVGIHDMDHDGDPEIVAGRVIFNSDGTVRGIGEHGRGSYGLFQFGDFLIGEASVSAVADLDLDGTEELIVGNAAYTPDGETLWSNGGDDGMVAIANLDSDPEGEILAITGNTVRAMDTDGSLLWGPIAIPSANILATPAVGDLDLDGWPELVTAGGNELYVLNHDGSTLWTASVTDESGATGASIFDFEGDGLPEVVYIDEVEMAAYDGATGALKFYSTEHSSNTMFDYPVVADVDADDQAEIVVCHNGFGAALSVYGDQDQSWVTARKVWNQHPYSIGNINDDLSIPSNAVPGFSDHNTWHSGISTAGLGLVHDVEAMILDVCDEECLSGSVYVTVRLHNKSAEEVVPAGTAMALYKSVGGTQSLVMSFALPNDVDPGMSSKGIVLQLPSDDVADADTLRLVADDDGTGTGTLNECAESNNAWNIDGPFCQ